MKHCPNCHAEWEKDFEVCWKCNYSLREHKIVNFKDLQDLKRQIDCLRCETKLSFIGEYKFHEGPKLGIMGNVFEALVNQAVFDLYICKNCGKIEFFAPLRIDDSSI